MLYKQNLRLVSIFMLSIVGSLVACQNLKPIRYSSEAHLVANAYQQGLSKNINLDYQQAYFNLKQAYQRCVAYTKEDTMIFTDNRFEPDLHMGTLFARTGDGDYLYKMLVEGLRDGTTRLTLFLPQQHKAAQKRFEQDVSWALAKDPKCNHSPKLSKQP